MQMSSSPMAPRVGRAADEPEALVQGDRLDLARSGRELQFVHPGRQRVQRQLVEQCAADALPARGRVDDHAFDLAIAVMPLQGDATRGAAGVVARDEEAHLGLLQGGKRERSVA